MPPSDRRFRLQQIESSFLRHQEEERARGHFHQSDPDNIVVEHSSSKDVVYDLFPEIVLLADSGGISDIRVANDEHMSDSEARIRISVSRRIPTRSQ